MREDWVERVIDVVRGVPEGRVVSYGDIARHVGTGGARHVGTVMSRYGADLPWWRVIRSDGRPPAGHEAEAVQRWRAEGTPTTGFGEATRADMRRARWELPGQRAEGGTSARGLLHHVEVWVPDLPRASREWGWLLGALGYERADTWEHGEIWQLGPTYLVLEHSTDLVGDTHERCRPGVNHLAFHGGSRTEVDALTAGAPEHGWMLMYPERHPFAGGSRHYAAFLSNSDGYEVEVVAG